MPQAPQVSICIPTYNGADHLRECLESVLAQRFADYEVLICDDNSSDGTLDLAAEIVGGDKRFRLIPNPKRYGLVGNWNNCIRQAKGEWIKFVFQDDVIAPACVGALLGACEKTGNRFAFSDRDFIFDESVSDELRKWLSNHRIRLKEDYGMNHVIDSGLAAEIAFHHFGHNPVGEPTVTLFHRSLIRELGEFDESLIHLCDAEYWWRVMLSHGAVRVPEVQASFRVHAKAATASNLRSRWFQLSILDPLIIRYRFLFDRNYETARRLHLTEKAKFRARLNFIREVGRLKEQMDADETAEWRRILPGCRGMNWFPMMARDFDRVGRLKQRILKVLSKG